MQFPISSHKSFWIKTVQLLKEVLQFYQPLTMHRFNGVTVKTSVNSFKRMLINQVIN